MRLSVHTYAVELQTSPETRYLPSCVTGTSSECVLRTAFTTNTEMYGVTDLKYYVFIKAETTKKQTGSLKQLDKSRGKTVGRSVETSWLFVHWPSPMSVKMHSRMVQWHSLLRSAKRYADLDGRYSFEPTAI